MKMRWALGLVVLCSLAAGLMTMRADDGRELRELARRVDKLERSQNEINQAVGRLTKSIADLEKRMGANQRSAGNDRTDREQQEKRINQLEKRLADLSKAVTTLQKQVSPQGDVPAALDKKFDERTVKLAELFDQYHPNSNTSYHHRNEIKRIR